MKKVARRITRVVLGRKKPDWALASDMDVCLGEYERAVDDLRKSVRGSAATAPTIWDGFGLVGGLVAMALAILAFHFTSVLLLHCAVGVSVVSFWLCTRRW